MSGLGPRSRPGRQETIVLDGCGEKVVIKVEIGCETTPPCHAENQVPAVPIPTPFLVIPWTPTDHGTRPIPMDLAVRNPSVQVDAAPAAAATGDYQIQLSCLVANLGAVASPAAVAEFYVGVGPAMSDLNSAHEQLTPSQVKAATQLVGRASFSVSAGGTTTVSCQVPWNRKRPVLGRLVQVFDLLSDPWTAPFDAVNDRHVARNDEVALMMPF